MGKNTTRSALLVIDMENAFLSKESAHCVPMAAATVPACVRAVRTARSKQIPVFFIKRLYRINGSDVELSRYLLWREGGRSLAPGSTGPFSAQAPEGLRPIPGDYTIIKPRYSAFFQTELDLILRRLAVDTVILCGTAVPNCIRTTAYDADSLGYGVVLLEDCCSSATQEIQDANLADLRRIGVHLLTASDLETYDERTVENLASVIREDMETSGIAPEPWAESEAGVFRIDLW